MVITFMIVLIGKNVYVYNVQVMMYIYLNYCLSLFNLPTTFSAFWLKIQSIFFFSWSFSLNFLHTALLELVIDLQECNDEVLDTCANHFPLEIDFSNTHISTSGACALGRMLPLLKQDVKLLDLSKCNLSADSMNRICDGISKMNVRVGFCNSIFQSLHSFMLV